ncbi:DUF6305 family protein [Virgibacillus necropolis]|uniref:DUF6305 family protein n=1 Tax=Virgibacillus necropolis TaxID=163877 RepID=UPI00384F6BE7
MYKKFIPSLVCLAFAFIFLLASNALTKSNYINSYPHLPAPIGQEKLLITSAGQSAEGMIALNMAENLNLHVDYRPLALATDLYDYKSVVIILGYSPNGLAQTQRSFEEEKKRINALLAEANNTNLPIILVHISGKFREEDYTRQFIEDAIPYADYFIGLKELSLTNEVIMKLKKNNVPTTLVNDVADMQIPFNSVFR